METEKIELLGKSLPELEEFAVGCGQPKYRARQLFKWIYYKETVSFYEMTDLPKELRVYFDEIAKISMPRVMKQRVAQDGTRKFSMELEDKKRIETVVIPHNAGKQSQYTLCISTQVGCPIGCLFCATGQSGFQRNLTFYEIIGQVLGSKKEIQKRLKSDDDDIISNIVYMGMGEPLLNYEETLKSIYIINDPKGINIGQRHITISTCGEVKGIQQLAAADLQVTLAISLHAANDNLRDRLIPLNRKYPLAQLMKAAEDYIAKTNRRVTFEYILLDDVNNSYQDAKNLIKLVKPLMANVNIIPYNSVNGLDFSQPDKDKVMQFYNWLLQGGLNVTLREEKGADIEAACGQLVMKRSGKSQQ
ncbi:MAG TPA: 23S rRNA (adenine(2503)-C(2))-methyltransferase RlmN [Syntrophomonadaceae bacterium]|nr:23S rRNA (adenine(2503)-C(2))-methyltransferase RlmN [Syntrophomonadaceae bacterium]HNX29010.1 23S rRNA (adenine(2503)-C(2))-methyltransferase RlmN [Syntrophomonadaceae bacterium]HPR93766.1 23S rRNA (adenine(2503)-C(2))-methyltransferase RlmN [Syntrophomonadaceae bacterium]